MLQTLEDLAKLSAGGNVTAQPTLFDPEQPVELARVTGAIGQAVLRFCRMRLNIGEPEFHAGDLRNYSATLHGSAPGSADRILRALRRAGQVTYIVVNRRASLYRIIRVS